MKVEIREMRIDSLYSFEAGAVAKGNTNLADMFRRKRESLEAQQAQDERK